MMYFICTDLNGACWESSVKREQIIALYKYVKELGAKTISYSEFGITTIWFKFDDMENFRTLCSYEIDPRPFHRMINTTAYHE